MFSYAVICASKFSCRIRFLSQECWTTSSGRKQGPDGTWNEEPENSVGGQPAKWAETGTWEPENYVVSAHLAHEEPENSCVSTHFPVSENLIARTSTLSFASQVGGNYIIDIYLDPSTRWKYARFFPKKRESAASTMILERWSPRRGTSPPL